MYSKLVKKYNLTQTPNENQIAFYNEDCEKCYIDKNSPYLDKVKSIYIEDNKNIDKEFMQYVIYKEKEVRGYYFFILKVEDYVNEIIDIVKEVVEGSIILKYMNYLIVLHKYPLEMKAKTLSDSINEDFYSNIQVFEGFKLSSTDHLLFVFSLYRYHLQGKNYANLQDLIMSMVKRNSKILSKLKPVVLKKLNNDFQIEKIINGMFENNLNVSKTSNSVFMHRNTINNKLELIKDETSLDIQSFKDAMAMYFLVNTK